MENNNRWIIARDKYVKVFAKCGKVTFQRLTKKDLNHRSRGVTLTKDAFLKMDDVSIAPASHVNLDKNIVLTNYGRTIQLTKYCFSKDNKQCDGALFFFTPSEWSHFWNGIRSNIIKRINE